MCGIAGIIDFEKGVTDAEVRSMTDAIRHRGPDDEGLYINSSKTVGLGHRRLSFLDLSEKGRQPLCNEDGSVWITFNGEIYNYRELKKELEQSGHKFKSNTDSEVLVHGYEQWGVKLLDKLLGMWAFAIWDEKSQTLFAARDRFGIKPLYYGEQNGRFVFASEIKAIATIADYKRTLNKTAFADYFNYRYVPAPNTIWNEIKKLPAAHYLVLKNGNYSIHEYWKLGSSNKQENHNQLVEEVDEILFNSVKLHAVSDVPVGAFLSGGYDSSAIAYYLHRMKYPLQTFSIGFNNWANSEHKFAELVAQQLGSNHTSYIVDDAHLELLDHLAWVYDEPLADISTLPTYMVSKVAAQHVKAVMSGEGSDEIFVGYTWQREFEAKSIWQRLKYNFERHQNPYIVEYYAEAMDMGRFDAAEQKKLLHPNLHHHISENSDWFYAKNFDKNLSPLKSIQQMDMKCFMGELVLTKVDRASMANNIEVRVPFLNHQLFEKIFSLQENQYHQPQQTKSLLYAQLKSVFPKEILQRRKQGFVGPDVYYQNIYWYKAMLENSRLVKDELINQFAIDTYIANGENWKLWKIVVMELWYRKWC
ncbi:MAG: asparagine synthase (glutamine-hydrolyzing) [Chitinophagales bacterium]|nr:asparagine synthase (glutamine-hydrolyzing) [Chitinophagales bacterium]